MVIRASADPVLEGLFATLGQAASSVRLDRMTDDVVREAGYRVHRRRSRRAVAFAALLIGVTGGVVPLGSASRDGGAMADSPLALAPSTLLGT